MKWKQFAAANRKQFATAFAAVLLACGDSTAPEPTVTGRWLGTAPITTTANMTMNVTLVQTGTAVTGNGTIAAGNESFAFSVTGTFIDPNLSMTISSTGFEQMNYTGRLVTSIQIDGTLSGSGFNNDVLNLSKQP